MGFHSESCSVYVFCLHLALLCGGVNYTYISLIKLTRDSSGILLALSPLWRDQKSQHYDTFIVCFCIGVRHH